MHGRRKRSGLIQQSLLLFMGKNGPALGRRKGPGICGNGIAVFPRVSKKSAERSPFFNRRRITGRKKSSMPGRDAGFGIRKPGSLEPVPVAMDAILPERVPSGRPAPPGRGGKFLSPAEIRRLREKGHARRFSR